MAPPRRAAHRCDRPVALAALNPDGYIAEQNVARYHDTGKLDTSYLAGLSADAVPALINLDPACLQDEPDVGRDDWLEWNLGRARARDALAGQAPATGVGSCVVAPS